MLLDLTLPLLLWEDSLMLLDITTLFLPLVESSLMLELQANFRMVFSLTLPLII